MVASGAVPSGALHRSEAGRTSGENLTLKQWQQKPQTSHKEHRSWHRPSAVSFASQPGPRGLGTCESSAEVMPSWGVAAVHSCGPRSWRGDKTQSGQNIVASTMQLKGHSTMSRHSWVQMPELSVDTAQSEPHQPSQVAVMTLEGGQGQQAKECVLGTSCAPQASLSHLKWHPRN